MIVFLFSCVAATFTASITSVCQDRGLHRGVAEPCEGTRAGQDFVRVRLNITFANAGLEPLEPVGDLFSLTLRGLRSSPPGTTGRVCLLDDHCTDGVTPEFTTCARPGLSPGCSATLAVDDCNQALVATKTGKVSFAIALDDNEVTVEDDGLDEYRYCDPLSPGIIALIVVGVVLGCCLIVTQLVVCTA